MDIKKIIPHMGLISLGLMVATACVEAPKVKSRDGESAAARSGTTFLTFTAPEEKQFNSLDDIVEEHIKEYVVKVTANSSQCAQWEIAKVIDYSPGKEFEYEVSAACDWQITVAIGKTKDSDSDSDAVNFEAYYQAQRRIFREKLTSGERLIGIDLEYERTPAGGSVGLLATTIDVEASSGASVGDDDGKDRGGDDGDSKDDDKNDEDKNDDDKKDEDQGGSAVTYNGQIKAILERSCTSCHRPGGSRSTSDLTSFSSAANFQSAIVGLVLNGSMPPGSPLSASQKKLFEDWRDGKFKE